MQSRDARSAIVVTSTGLAGRPMPGCVTYSSAKVCSSYMAQALNYELKDKIDVLSWEAGVAGTKMFPEEKRAKMSPVGPGVDGMLKDIGKEALSFGNFKNDLSCCMLPYVPNQMLHPMMYKGMQKSYHNDLQKLKKEDGDLDAWIRR